MLKPIPMKAFVVSCLAPCILCLLLLSTCSDDDRGNTCSVDDPARDLPWLKKAIETYQLPTSSDATIEQGTYRFRTVFIISLCCPTCRMAPLPVFTCEGVAIDNLSPADENIKGRKVIWKTDGDQAICW
jgi:hypothetical protein